MAKVDLDILKTVLKRSGIDVRKAAQIIEDVNQAQKELDADSEKTPTVKKKYAVLLSDPEGDLEGKEYSGWILQIPEDDSEYETEQKLHRSAYAFNITKRGRALPVETIGDVCESVPAKILKEEKVWVRTKEAVAILRTDNAIPLEKTDKKHSRRGE